MAGRVHISNDTFESFLEQSEQTITHYNLLDHQDWMAEQRTDLLLKEWNLILKNARPGTQIIQRTAANELDFIPESISSHLRFHPELTQNLHSTDRVGTYGSLHFAEVSDYVNI
jgi:S-adenosylmethionine-diacylglycerol 3-amino-3-carboxypropyl transferase